MNSNKHKIASGVIVLALVVAGYFVFGRSQPVVPIETPPLATSTTPATDKPVTTKPVTRPVFETGSAQIVTPIIHIAENTLVSTSSYPTLMGTANVPTIQIVIVNSRDVGLAETQGIPVVDGQWVYHSPIALTLATYTVIATSGATSVKADLVVR